MGHFVFQVTKMQFNSPPLPTPLVSVGCLQVNHLLPILHRLRTPTLFGGAGGAVRINPVKAVFLSVYCRLAANSIQKYVKKGRSPRKFWPGL